jgi:hypothetical protein
MDASKGVLTIRNLPKLIDDANARRAVQKLVDEAISKSEFCKDLRDRHIAHRSLALATNPKSVRPLKSGSRKQVDSALDGIVAVLNAVSAHYQDSETFFRPNSGPGGAVSLLYVLDSGVRADAERRERLRSGGYTESDYAPKDL